MSNAAAPVLRSEQVQGLDRIRFVSALMVALGHGLAPKPFDGMELSHPGWWFANGVYNNLFNGPAAVILFFVLSGFCIHWPYRAGAPLLAGSFLLRRLTRISLPVVALLLLTHLLGVPLSNLKDSILWSLFAEVVYYALYPFLLPLGRRFGFTRWVLASFLAVGVLLIVRPVTDGNYVDYGWSLTWLLGLPCWLLGCWLAENLHHLRSPKVRSRLWIWTWRLGIYGASVLVSGLRFHSPLKYPHTLDLFALLATFYIREEILWARQHPAASSGLLDKGGAWSYSLYLTHLSALTWFFTHQLHAIGGITGWLFRLVFVLASAFVFYLLVERPSHWMARRLGASTRAGPRVAPSAT